MTVKKMFYVITLVVTIIIWNSKCTHAEEFAKIYEKVFFRGTPNAWGTFEMKLIADNLWRTNVKFESSSSERFKFDINGNWALNFGDSNNDGICEKGGKDIPVGGGKTYEITFNDGTKAYTVKEVKDSLNEIKKDEPLRTNLPAKMETAGVVSSETSDANLKNYKKTYTSMNFRGTPNGWASTPMKLIADYTWEIKNIKTKESAAERFKFDVNGDWTINFGAGGAKGGKDIPLEANKSYTIIFNDMTKEIKIEIEK